MAEVTKNLKELKEQNQEVTKRDCPDCGEHKLIVKWSRNGKFLACPGFPKCKYTESLEPEETEESDEVCEACGEPMLLVKRGTKKFYRCSSSACKKTKAITTGIKCPNHAVEDKKCEGELVERITKRGKPFYGCNAFPKCRFAVWDKPLDEKCPTCGFPILTLKESKSRGEYKVCPNADCKAEFGGNEVESTDEE